MKSPIAINAGLLKKFLQIAGDKLEGDWVIIGGTVLPALGIDHRVTTDIDWVGLSNPTQEDTLKIMEIAESLGLPIESINQAGAFFLNRIKNFKKNMVELRRGKKATIFLPNLMLFLKLKTARLSETDLTDCLEYIAWQGKQKTSDLTLIKQTKSWIDKITASETDPDKKNKLAILQKALAKI